MYDANNFMWIRGALSAWDCRNRLHVYYASKKGQDDQAGGERRCHIIRGLRACRHASDRHESSWVESAKKRALTRVESGLAPITSTCMAMTQNMRTGEEEEEGGISSRDGSGGLNEPDARRWTKKNIWAVRFRKVTCACSMFRAKEVDAKRNSGRGWLFFLPPVWSAKKGVWNYWNISTSVFVGIGQKKFGEFRSVDWLFPIRILIELAQKRSPLVGLTKKMWGFFRGEFWFDRFVLLPPPSCPKIK